MDNKEQAKTATPEPKDDIVTNLFGDDKAETKPVTPLTPPEPPKEEKPTLDESKIQDIAVASAQKAAKEMVESATSQLKRQNELNTWFNSPDGKAFLPYKEFIEKAASDPRFAAISAEQLPAVVLKPSAYAKVLQDVKTEADKAAKDSKTGGTSNVTIIENDGTQPDYKNMSREDFNKTIQENKKKMVGKR